MGLYTSLLVPYRLRHRLRLARLHGGAMSFSAHEPTGTGHGAVLTLRIFVKSCRWLERSDLRKRLCYLSGLHSELLDMAFRTFLVNLAFLITLCKY